MGEHGGAVFILFYLVCMCFVGFPVLISEIMVGRRARLNPSGSFHRVGKSRGWQRVGKMTILTGFLISSFYCVIAGWTLYYFFQALFGGLSHFFSAVEAVQYFQEFSASPVKAIGSVIVFLLIATSILYTGVRRGIEASNKVMMPLLLFVLIILAIRGYMMPGGDEGIAFLCKPKWSKIAPATILLALGQAFFSLSLGQGTMVTYGSYLKNGENLPKICLPIILFGICISLLAGVAIFTVIFSAQLPPSSGESLMFQTLPIIFAQMPGGYFLCVLFFLLLVIAALTSQISAMEPCISYLMDKRCWQRGRAVIFTSLGVFFLSLPSLLSFGVLGEYTLFKMHFFQLLLFTCLNILIPLGGLGAVILVGWRWGFRRAFPHLKGGTGNLFGACPLLKGYFYFSIKYIAPTIIIIIMLNGLGLF